MLKIGTRAQVMHGTALQTSGGLTKKDLKYNKQGRIVSKKKSIMAKKEKRLEKAGYKTQKGVFGSFKKGGMNDVYTLNDLNQINNEPLKKAIFAANIPKSAHLIPERKNANPNNAIFIDESNGKVYKIGLYRSIESSRKSNKPRTIENECIAYDKLMKNDEHINVHFPRRFECINIGKFNNRNYGKLVIQYIPDLIPINFNNNNNKTKLLITEAKKYLKNLGIKHNDEEKNLFKKDDSFFWIDFEAATFSNNDSNNEMNINYNNNNNNNNNNRPRGLFNNNRPRGLFDNNNNNNYNNMII